MKKVREGSAEIFIYQGKISKELPVFYNPVMKLNRDITILLLKQFKPIKLCDPLAGTGIRAIRFAKELKYKSIVANDNSKGAVTLIRKNMKHNKVKFEVKNKDASIMLLESKGFDFIDLDVFGSPNFVLDASVKRISRNGILAVTATDTACLSGTFPKTCLRKYWAIPLRNEIMHEIGLRILIRKIQLIAAQYDKALMPIFSYAKEHYMRVFFKCIKGKQKVDTILKRHGMFNEAGPLWLGNLWDKALVNKMYKDTNEKILLRKINSLVYKVKKNNREITNFINNEKFLKIIKNEAKIPVVGFFDIHKLAKKYKFKSIPKKELLIKKIKEKYKASETHFSPQGIKSDIPEKELLKIFNQ